MASGRVTADIEQQFYWPLQYREGAFRDILEFGSFLASLLSGSRISCKSARDSTMPFSGPPASRALSSLRWLLKLVGPVNL